MARNTAFLKTKHCFFKNAYVFSKCKSSGRRFYIALSKKTYEKWSSYSKAVNLLVLLLHLEQALNEKVIVGKLWFNLKKRVF